MSHSMGIFGEVRIGVVARAIFVGEALGFDLRVKRCGGLESHAAEIEIFGDVEKLESGEALRVGGHGVDVEAAIVGDERIEPFGVLFAKIGARDPAADAFEIGFDRLRDGAVVVSVAAALGDHFVSAREIGIAEDVAFVGSFAAGRPGVHGVGGFFDAGIGARERGEIALDVGADDLRNGHAGFGEMNRGLEEFVPISICRSAGAGSTRRRARRGRRRRLRRAERCTPFGERARTVSSVSALGERPEPARLTTLESLGSQIIA